ncbi:retrovirus-related pol polyprotein from transposon TNT 1-94 [Tanacetum coccineum]
MTYPCHWFSKQVGLAGDLGSTNDVLIPLCMTRSLRKDLIQPFDEPERVFHSNLKLFKTSTLDYSSSPEFNLFFKYEDQSEGEVIETITEPTIEEYMTRAREGHGPGIARPKIKEKDHFKLKANFLRNYMITLLVDQIMKMPMNILRKSLRLNEPTGSITTWDLKEKFLSKCCPPARTAKKIKEINNFQQDTDETLYQAWEQFKKLLLRCPQHYLTDMQEVILFYKGLDVPTRDILDFKGAIPSMKVTDAKKFIQDMVDHSQKWHNGTSTRCRSIENSDGLAAIQA